MNARFICFVKPLLLNVLQLCSQTQGRGTGDQIEVIGLKRAQCVFPTPLKLQP